MRNLAICVLGHRNSGKSTTWYDLFGSRVKTGKEIRRLYLNEEEFVEVFLVSGSPEERHAYVGDLIGDKKPRIILCSMQYIDGVRSTIDYFLENEYEINCQWLNPGHQDHFDIQMFDHLGLNNYLLARNAVVSIQNGKINTSKRIQLIKDVIYGWAKFEGLIKK